MTDTLPLTLGALYQGSNRCLFRVWAPHHRPVHLQILSSSPRTIPLTPDDDGYHSVLLDNIPPGTRYLYQLDPETARPDPASRSQPEGVHAPSAVVDPAFTWHDHDWRNLPLKDYVTYELHVGTFTPEGTFDAIIPRLPRLRELGITALELMPVAQFPGTRNWGYDGVYPYATQHSYGSGQGLKRLVDAAHQHGLAVVLDVVYNHLGPEGNYLGQFAPYFTDHYRTPWGLALNFDGPDSHHVRRYFIENALQWQTEFHLDALRLDAVHAITDFSAIPFLEELAATCHDQATRLGRPFHLIAESDMNMARHILPPERGGYGLDAQWSDDFHHALHVLLTGERNGYYSDFGGVEPLAKVFREGYAYTGELSHYRRRRHGSSPEHNPAHQFVVCIQNHDQVGNRMLGDRLSATLNQGQLRLAAATVLLSPFPPLLFMGEEYGETAPFQYFVSHGDPSLVEAVRKGRQAEFASFQWQGEIPDPQAEMTFQQCKLQWDLADQGTHRVLHDFYRTLLSLRRRVPALAHATKDSLTVKGWPKEQLLTVHYHHSSADAFACFAFAAESTPLPVTPATGSWRKILDTADPSWGGPGSGLPDQAPAKDFFQFSLPAQSVLLWERADS